MKEGKKSTAEKLVYGALDKIRDRTSEDPLKVFKKAVDNVKPTLEVKSRRVGGSNYQVPIEVRPERRTSLSLRWLVNFARFPSGEDDDRQARWRVARCGIEPRRRCEEARGYPPNGGSE